MSQSCIHIAIYVSISYICLLLHMTTQNNPILSVFFKAAPQATEYLNKIKKPGRIAKYNLQGIVQTDFISGIMGTYAGYINLSDLAGQLLFPRKQSSEIIILAITPKISPIMRFEQTIDHWQFIPGQPIALYKLTRVQESDSLFYWHIKKMDIPTSNLINYNTIVLFAKPKNIYVPQAKQLTSEGPHLLLPDIYIKKAINIVKHGTYILHIKHLFRPVESLYKKEKKQYTRHIIS